MRVILYTGKGGVGKTSIAAATALRCEELGYKTIVFSTDAAHSLSDSFGVELGNEPRQIADNLWGQETEMSQTLNIHWERVQKWVKALFTWRGMDEVMADEMALLPGIEEGANLIHIANYFYNSDYDVIVVDCAPTGETLRLLSFPDILRWWMDKLFPLQRTGAGIIRPFAKRLSDIPFPEDDVFDSAEDLFKEMYRARNLLTEPETTTVRLVLNPEKMVIKEAQRSFTCFNLYDYSADLVISNRMIPEEVNDQHFAVWKESQSKYRQMIKESFGPVPVLDVPLFAQEMVGIPMLRLMGKSLFDDEDPTKIFFRGESQAVEKTDGYYILTVALPFTDKEDISLTQSGNELIVQAGKYKRNIMLPHALVGLPIGGAKFEDNNLRIRFKEQE